MICPVCAYPYYEVINRHLVNGYSYEALARIYKISEPAVRNHARKHMVTDAAV